MVDSTGVTTRLPAPPSLPARLQTCRQARQLTQHDCAALARINRITLYRIEQGAVPYLSVGTLLALATALDVSTDFLLGVTDDARPRRSVRPASHSDCS